ncbi:hypothetical protein [Streptococcus hyointestinalis]|uniref:hypothetical protein n=1 Tax=Streptococcus hyointestinalis TaxID=1337 RepID=UPI0013DE8312|nr:hypothetical protein [Streptococcus hyointestinalis]
MQQKLQQYFTAKRQKSDPQHLDWAVHGIRSTKRQKIFLQIDYGFMRGIFRLHKIFYIADLGELNWVRAMFSN